MAAARKHSDVLVAGLILVGATMWLFAHAHAIWGLDQPARLAMWLFSSFIAAQIARRLLPDLDFGETAMAAIVAMAIVVGIFSQRQGRTLDIEMLAPIAAAAAGALAGAFTSRRRSAEAHVALRVAGAGFASFGAAMLMVGVALLLTTREVHFFFALCGGAMAGSFAIARFAAVSGRQCALGLALVLGAMLARSSGDFTPIAGGLIGLGLGAVLGAIGGGVGARMRTSRKPPTDLPEAQVR